MRTIVAALVSLAAASVAHAADFYTVPSPLNAYSWAGPYLGATVGYEWGRVSNNPTAPSGLAGGVEAGYNWQQGQFVYGGETDLNLSAADATLAPWEFSNPWFGTLRGRAGVALGNVLVFGSVGLAYGELRLDTAGLSEYHTNLGWAGGGGVEVGFNPRWSVKAEWLYLDLAGSSFTGTGTTNGLTANLIRLGVNYRF